MLVARHRQLLLASAALLTFVLCALVYSNVEIRNGRPELIHRWTSGAWTAGQHRLPEESASTSDQKNTGTTPEIDDHDDPNAQSPLDLDTQHKPTPFASETHHEIFSQTTKDGRYFLVQFGDHRAMNPNIIPHPTQKDVWFIIAQQYKDLEMNWAWFTELACEASFKDGGLQCLEPPSILPIASSPSSPHCTGDLDYYDASIGPHDARVFYGPNRPYVIYGSQSQHSCFGLWMQDFRRLVDWKHDYEPNYPFRQATDLQRPAPAGIIEKNWFVFWSLTGEEYTHYDIFPRRAFAKLEFDGSVSSDLAILAKEADYRCMERFMKPELTLPQSKFHQATNSLSITMCARADPACVKSADNTFVFTIFQKKTEVNLHSVYEPYVMLFDQTAPFGIHALSSKPILIHGRKAPGDHDAASSDNESRTPPDQSEMLYVTSMSWKDSGRKYHGYLDDVVFVAFGIEDHAAGGIDVLASDLLAQIGLCDDM